MNLEYTVAQIKNHPTTHSRQGAENDIIGLSLGVKNEGLEMNFKCDINLSDA